jgi:hypothetical protein
MPDAPPIYVKLPMSSIVNNQQPILPAEFSLDLADLLLELIFRLRGRNSPYLCREVELVLEDILQVYQLVMSPQVIFQPVQEQGVDSNVLSRLLGKHRPAGVLQVIRE